MHVRNGLLGLSREPQGGPRVASRNIIVVASVLWDVWEIELTLWQAPDLGAGQVYRLGARTGRSIMVGDVVFVVVSVLVLVAAAVPVVAHLDVE